MADWKLNPDAKLFEALANSPPQWWCNLIADPEIWADVRKGNRINVYHRGGSIMDLSYSRGFNARIHFEYVPLQSSKTHVAFIFDEDGGIELDQAAVVVPPMNDFSADVLKQLKKRVSKFNPSGSEKHIQSEFVLKNPGFIDTEFQHDGDRIDLVWLDVPTKRIIFVELKTIGDKRLFEDDATSAEPKGIAAQLRRYRDFVSGNAPELADYYRRLFKTKKKLRLLRGVELKKIENIDDFEVEPRPLLLIGDCTRAWIRQNADLIDSRVRDIALGVFYHGLDTRDFRVPSRTTGNKHLFGP